MLKAENALPLLAVWDSIKKPITLGGLLTIAAESLILKREKNADLAGICFVGKHSGFPYSRAFQEVEEYMFQENWILVIARSIKGIEKLYVAPSIESLDHAFSFWPESKDKSYQHATYFFLQDYCNKGNKMIPLGMDKKTLKLAKDYIKRVSGKSLAVAIHLKNNHNSPGFSNANFPVWKQFFETCLGQYNVHFILVGNEDIPDDIALLDNVALTKHDKLTIAQELAVIEASAFFMGMSSGPCNMALLSLTPCAIFKNPDHDKAEMDQELGRRNRFTFCTSEQKLIRKLETTTLLMNEFKRLYKSYEA